MIKRERLSDSSGVRTTGILIAVVFVLYMAREILIPLSFAITLALILSPAVTWLQKLGFGRVPAVAAVIRFRLPPGAELPGSSSINWWELANELPSYKLNIDGKLKAIRAPGTGAFGRATASVQELSRKLSGVPAANAPAATGPTGGRRGTGQPAPPVSVHIVQEPLINWSTFATWSSPFWGQSASLESC